MHEKRAISLIFIFLMVAGTFTTLAQGALADEQKDIIYQVQIYDQKGRLLPENYSVIGAKLKSIVYTERYILGIPIGWQKIGEYSGGVFQFKAPIGQRAKIVVFWYDKEQYDNVFYLGTNEIINITLPFIPCVPITDVRAESIGISADMHEINTPHYNVKFGQGRDKNEIWIQLDDEVFPISAYMVENSNNHPFQFLAQSPNTTVKGKSNFLIWTTTEYVSGVHTYKIGDNALIVVWTYIYTDVAGAWVKKVIASALAGAILGTMAEPGVGTIAGGLVGGLAAGVAWALKPELANISASSEIGVVAGYFTPRWFIIQGVGGLGTNHTYSQVKIDTSKINNGDIIINGDRYQVYKESNSIQVAYTKYKTKAILDKYYTFEDGKAPWNFQNGSIRKGNAYEGDYAWFSPSRSHSDDPFPIIIVANSSMLQNGTTYILSLSFYYKASAGGKYIYITAGDTEIASAKLGPGDKWLYFSQSFTFTYHGEGTLCISPQSDGYTYMYFDDFKMVLYNSKDYRILLDTQHQGDASISKYVFDTIPEIAPIKNKPLPISQSYSMLAVDVAGTDGFVAVDWASPQVPVYYSRLYIRTPTWHETAWLFFTDAKNGFKDITFLITEPKNFVYHIDLFQYYALSTPDNWTFTPDWTPLIVNHTMIFLPPKDWNGVNLYSMWDEMHYNLESWWQNIGTLGHLALYGLGLLIIFIIVLIIAPWLIIALIKILGLILRGLFNVLGVIFKGIGKAMKHKRRR